jgi:hypothetical protein
MLVCLGWLAVLLPQAAQACATCYGASDAPMAQGMNWGIMSLLAVIGTVLGGVVSFFVFLGVRASKVSSTATPSSESEI